MLASYTSSNAYLYDMETTQQILQFDSKQNTGEDIWSIRFLLSIGNAVYAQGMTYL